MQLALALATVLCSPSDVPVAPRPDWVVPAMVDLQAEVPADGVVGGMYRDLIDSQVRFANGTRSDYAEIAWHVVDSQGVQNGSRVSIEFDPSYEEVTLHAIEVLRNGETIDRLDPEQIEVLQREEELESEIYDGSHTLVAFIDDVRPGDVVRYAYTSEGSNPAYEGHYLNAVHFAGSVPIGYLRHRLVWESERALTILPRGDVPEPQVTDRGDRTEYVWEVRETKAVRWEQALPAWYYPTPWVQFTTFQDWNELARWQTELLKLPEEHGPELEQAIEAIRAAHAEPEEQALAAARFVQDEIRYLGIELGVGAYAPRPPDEVYRRRYGDCKDKSLLLATMLRSLGIPSRLALVSFGHLHTVAEYAPSPIVFDHVILRVDLPYGPVWVDPTESFVGGDLESSEPAPFGFALVADPETTELAPVSNGEHSGVTRIHWVIDGREVGEPAELRVRTTYEGRNAAHVRESFGWAGREEYSKNCLNYYRVHFEQAEAKGPVLLTDDREANVVTTTEVYTLPGFWELEEDVWAAQIVPIEMVQALPAIERSAGGHPVGIPYPTRIEQSVVVQLGDDWELERESVVMDNPGFRFTADISSHTDAGGSRFRFDYSYIANADHIAPEHLEQAFNDQEEAYEYLDYRLTHAGDPTEGFSGFDGFDAERLFDTLSEIGSAMNLDGEQSSDPADLYRLFEEWRAFEQPPLLDGAPDYTVDRMRDAFAELRTFQRRLIGLNRTGWTLEQQVDWHLVRAELNGFDFDCRVLRPWARDPAFYQTVWTYQSDTPAHEGPTNHALLELWEYDFPLSEEARTRLVSELQVVPPLLEQARRNLVGNARDLWVAGIRTMQGQQRDLARLREGLGPEVHVELEGALRSAEAATREFVRWLESQEPSKTGPSGVGKEHYTWYQQNVHLSPMTWEDEVRLLQRELDRAWSSLRLEEQRNRDLPALVPAASPEEYDRFADEAASKLIAFLRDERVLPVKPNMEPALREHLGAFVPEESRNFFWIGAHLDPRPLFSHFYHWWDLAQMRDEPHASPVRRGPLLYNIFDSRSEGVATGVEELFMHAGLYAHANEMTMAEAGTVHVEWTPRGWMRTEPELLQFEQHLYLRQPGYGTSYVTGKYMLERLLAHVSKQAEERGEEFVLSDFFAELNGLGCIPMSLIRWQMTGLDDEIRALVPE